MKTIFCFLLLTVLLSSSAFADEATYIYSCTGIGMKPREYRFLKIKVEKDAEGKFIKLNSLYWFLHSLDAADEAKPTGPFSVMIIEESEKGSLIPTPRYRAYVNDWVRGLIRPNDKLSTQYSKFGEIIFPQTFITENQRMGWMIESDEQADGSLKVYSWNCWDDNAPVDVEPMTPIEN